MRVTNRAWSGEQNDVKEGDARVSEALCVRSHQSPAAIPVVLLVLLLSLLLSFVTVAHLLGMSAELVLLLITAVIGAVIKLIKVLPRLQRQSVL